MSGNIADIRRACTQYCSQFDSEQDFVRSLETDEAFDYFLNLGMDEEDVLTAYKMLRTTRGLFAAKESVLSEDKSRFIKKLPYNDEDKAKVLEFFKTHPNLENKINWTDKDAQVIVDSIDELIVNILDKKAAGVQKRAVYREKIPDFEAHGCKVLGETENWVFVGVPTYKAAVYCDSTECGGEGAQWCIGYTQSNSYWKTYTGQGYRFIMAYNKNKAINQKEFNELSAKYADSSHKIKMDALKGQDKELLLQGGLKYMVQIDKDAGVEDIWTQPDDSYFWWNGERATYFDGFFYDEEAVLQMIQDLVVDNGATREDHKKAVFEFGKSLGITKSPLEYSYIGAGGNLVKALVHVEDADSLANNWLGTLPSPAEIFVKIGMEPLYETEDGFVFSLTEENVSDYEHFYKNLDVCSSSNDGIREEAYAELEDIGIGVAAGRLLSYNMGGTLGDSISSDNAELPISIVEVYSNLKSSMSYLFNAITTGPRLTVGIFARKSWPKIHVKLLNNSKDLCLRSYEYNNKAYGGIDGVNTYCDEEDVRTHGHAFGIIQLTKSLITYCVGDFEYSKSGDSYALKHFIDHPEEKAGASNVWTNLSVPGFNKEGIQEWIDGELLSQPNRIPQGLPYIKTADNIIELWNAHIENIKGICGDTYELHTYIDQSDEDGREEAMAISTMVYYLSNRKAILDLPKESETVPIPLDALIVTD